MIQKLPLQPIETGGDLEDFSYISMIEPVSSSFYVSLGIGLFESLIRLQPYPEITHPTWVALFESHSQSKTIAAEFSLAYKHSEFKRVLDSVNNTDRKLALKNLESLSKSYEKLLAIDYGIRFILIRALAVDPKSVITGNFKNFMQAAKNISALLNIGFGIARGDKIKEFKSDFEGPMIFLYMSSRGQFGILYHKAVKYIDEKPGAVYADCSLYPFSTKISSLKTEPDQSVTQNILDLIEILADNIKEDLPRSVEKHIIGKIEALSKIYPGLQDIPGLKYIKKRNNKSITKEFRIFDGSLSRRIHGEPGFIPNNTSISLLSKKISKTPSPKKKNQGISVDYYKNLSNRRMYYYKNISFAS
ncbi:hypothetical protein SteCoe_26189 [Stentor coeruleus]|uniref:Uncharacterized protein n=1 Tax=Stentor coeruleus TaxID=5963 RepID=A0A1R2BDI4_9CILI|nr:hypothetical protein SteCoe_26189 [Stentor coeruleus]